jgi:hypothetical protein
MSNAWALSASAPAQTFEGRPTLCADVDGESVWPSHEHLVMVGIWMTLASPSKCWTLNSFQDTVHAFEITLSAQPSLSWENVTPDNFFLDPFKCALGCSKPLTSLAHIQHHGGHQLKAGLDGQSSP